MITNKSRWKQSKDNKQKTCSLFTVNCSLILLLIAIPCSLSALDININPGGFVFIPRGEGNKTSMELERYDIGGGGQLSFGVDIASVLPNPLGIGYTLAGEAGLSFNPYKSMESESLQLYRLGGNIGIYYYPISRLFTGFDFGIGAYWAQNENFRTNSAAMWYRYGGELGFRITPNFTVAGNAGWHQFQNSKEDGGALMSGVYAGLALKVTLNAGRGGAREGVETHLDQFEPMYPLFMQLYQEFPVSTIILRNNENAEIRNVRVYFRAAGYTASEFLCDEIYVLPKGRRVEVDLLADFSPSVLRFTDSGRIMGEIVIRYRFLGQEREVVRAVSVQTHNRNTIPAGDINSFAAFVSSTNPDVLSFASMIAGLERTNRRSGVNTNYQYAVWLLEGLRASGIRQNETFTESEFLQAQYPAETLAFTTGSSRDLALLFAACLESTGKRAALIQVTGNREQGTGSGNQESERIADNSEFLVAVSLGSVQQAGALANNRDRILIYNDEVWMPLSMNAFNNGFNAAWTQGYQILNRTFAANQTADLAIIQDAWVSYPPAPLPELGRSLRTDTNTATTRAMAVIGR